jgi:hypothetical protein
MLIKVRKALIKLIVMLGFVMKRKILFSISTEHSIKEI